VKVSPFSFVPEASDSSRRLDDLVMARLPSVFREQGLAAVASKSKLRRLILDGAVSVAGRPVRVPGIKVKPGTVITVYLDPGRFAVETTPGDLPFECTAADILYEDEWLVAVSKPPGIPTEGSFLASRDSLHAAVRRFLAARDGSFSRPGEKSRRGSGLEHGSVGPGPSNACEDGLPYLGLHHRLDRDTSGVVLFTKRREANAAVQRAFASRATHKVYRALVGPPQATVEKQFEVSGLMARISPKSVAAQWGLVQSDGVPSSTRFFVESSGWDGLVIRAEPLTGRTHQIRVHAASQGMPLFGDALYGGPDTLRGQAVPRVMLHAASLSLLHPVAGQQLELVAPVPPDFSQFQELLQI
jgi:23S rRNA pseudouridine1911/1915/1917 synthase